MMMLLVGSVEESGIEGRGRNDLRMLGREE